jgi:predicted PurR-regulated permease PerM
VEVFICCLFFSDLLILVITSLIIALSVNPLVDWLEKYKINRSLSSALILLFFLVLILFGISVATPLIDQTEVFLEKLPSIIETVSPIKIDMNSFNTQLAKIPGQVFNIAIGTFSGLFTAFTTIILSFYIIQEIKTTKLHRFLVCR